MTEQQRYDVVGTYDGFELRRYEPCVVAEVEVDGSFASAGNRAFRPLVGYISGRNRGERGVAMTAPVVQQPGRKLAMTSPVVQQEDADHHVVAFVMPAGETTATLPEPADPRVRLRDEPETLAAAARYSGRWTEGGYRDHVGALESAVRAAGLAVAGPARWARFDPPWTPWFVRRNEVVIPVVEPATS